MISKETLESLNAAIGWKRERRRIFGERMSKYGSVEYWNERYTK